MEHIILLHGFGSHGVTMSLLRQYIIKYSDYNVICPTYQSLFLTNIESITAKVIDFINPILSPNDTIHFIGHSLGGIIAKSICNSYRLKESVKIGNLVTLGTPHNGTLLADRVLRKFPFLGLLSPVAKQLRTKSYAETVQTPNINIGVIVGMSNNHLANPIIYAGSAFLKDIESHDGVVELESNLHKGIKHLTFIDVNHVEMLWSTPLFKKSLDFIKEGKFRE